MDFLSNGARFIREVNNSVFDVLLKLDLEDAGFWCECDDPACEEGRPARGVRGQADRDAGALLSRSHAARHVGLVREAAHA